MTKIILRKDYLFVWPMSFQESICLCSIVIFIVSTVAALFFGSITVASLFLLSALLMSILYRLSKIEHALTILFRQEDVEIEDKYNGHCCSREDHDQ